MENDDVCDGVSVCVCGWGGMIKKNELLFVLLLSLHYYYYMVTFTYLLQYDNFTTVLKKMEQNQENA